MKVCAKQGVLLLKFSYGLGRSAAVTRSDLVSTRALGKLLSSSSLSRSLLLWAVILASRWVILPNALLIRRGRYVARRTGRMPLGGIEARGRENVDVFLVDVITHFPVIALPVLQLIHRETMPLRLIISEENI